MSRPYIHILLQACATALAMAAVAPSASATDGPRPRVGLVLGGGGARGAAQHIHTTNMVGVVVGH